MRSASFLRPTEAISDLGSLALNLHAVRDFLGRGVDILAVVKADAYGHGAFECAATLANEGVAWLGVAIPEEGVELRQRGITTPILVLGGFWPGQGETLLKNSLTPVVFTEQQAHELNEVGRFAHTSVACHVKVDTGMGRLGIRSDEAERFAALLAKMAYLSVEGIMSHFASADDLTQSEFTNEQMVRFDLASEAFISAGHTPTYLDIANSPGAVGYPSARRKMVRLGGILYGLGGDVLPVEIDKPELRPVLSLRSRVASLKRVPAGESIGYGRTHTTGRESLIAAVPMGYADGYPRLLSNRAHVLINGSRAPVVGRISMDWILVDVTDCQNVEIGTDVILIGRSGALAISAEDLAQLAGTISYEITCGIGSRVRRTYVGKE